MNRIQERIFAVFAIYHNDDLIIEPEAINQFLAKPKLPIPPQIRVLPWQTEEFVFEFRNSTEVSKVVDQINDLVKQVDTEDPWYT